MIWLFVDDLKLLFSSLNFHNDLTRLYSWNLSNGMIANLGKTNCSNFKGLTSVTMNDCLLNKVEYTKDLGIIVSHSLKWTDSVANESYKSPKEFLFFEAKDSMANPIREKIQPLFLTSVICSFIWDRILVTRYNSFENNGKFSKAVLHMDFWFENLLSTVTEKSLLSSHLSPY